jgi:monoamine oxidase
MKRNLMPGLYSIPQHLDVIRRGIGTISGRPSRPKRVIVVGAGIAGLVAGYELSVPDMIR